MRLGWRSALFVPAIDEARIAKAHLRAADALILDLEDAVPANRKAEARAALGRAVDRLSGLGQAVAVRINAPWRLAFEDLESAVRVGVCALVIPKTEEVGRLAVLSDLVGEWEAERGLPPGGVALVPLIESPGALRHLHEIAAVERVAGLALGPEDFAAALGAPPARESLDLPCRLIALAAAARDVMALATPDSIVNYGDLVRYAEAAGVARAIGLTGALCIHPAQVEVLNTAFSPSEAEVATARQVLAAWEGGGSAGVVTFGGRMIDEPVARQAKRTLSRART